jgi:hypothetical protein
MKIITIKNSGWGSLSIHDGKLGGSRLEWQAGNAIQVYVKGPMTDCYDLACVMAIEYAASMGIDADDLRRQSKNAKRVPFTTSTKGMF